MKSRAIAGHSLAKFLLPLVLAVGVGIPLAQTNRSAPNQLTVTRFEGTSVITDLGYNIKINKASTLKREWFVLNDPASPLKIKGDSGVQVQYKAGDRTSSGQYQYMALTELVASEPISAYELRLHVFDVFGRHIKTLSATDVGDATGTKIDTSTWRIFSENEASEAYSSVLYVAQVRTAAGRVYSVDRASVLDHLRRVSSKITEAELDPVKK